MRALIIAACLLLAPAAAMAQYPVFDATHTAETIKNLSELQKHTKILSDTYTTATSIRNSIGGLTSGSLVRMSPASL